MREAFAQGAAKGLGRTEGVLPKSHIDRSLCAKGAAAYEALPDGEMAGGLCAKRRQSRCAKIESC